MNRMKRLMAIMLLALVATLGTPQAFAGPGEMVGIAAQAPAETDGVVAAILDYLALFI
jgi:hypothetical protein